MKKTCAKCLALITRPGHPPCSLAYPTHMEGYGTKESPAPDGPCPNPKTKTALAKEQSKAFWRYKG